MQKTVVIDIVGLSTSVIGKHTPFLQKYIAKNNLTHIKPAFPAVTTTAQSCYVTGKTPAEHGIVGNGWYDHEASEIKFWKQSNKLVYAEKIWEAAKRKNPEFTSSKMFWWYNMYSSADFSVTPRPQYHSDGVKMPDCYSYPSDLRDKLQKKFGTFPLFKFWGPGANIECSKWIANASMEVDRENDPTLTLIYLPHLDYCLQKFGTDFSKIAKELNEIDALAEELVTYYEQKNANIILLSEYGINNVSRPVHINRILRENSLVAIRVEAGLELLDAGASKAFAVADHQIAHIYVNDPKEKARVKSILEKIEGVALVMDEAEKQQHHINHKRAGDFVLMAKADSWFTYYYWNDDKLAPDFARSVDIHNKPGYDPVEMFMNPANPFIKLRAAYKLARKLLGFRYRMDVIPLDATLIKGSHGTLDIGKEYYPVLITNQAINQKEIAATDVYNVIWQSVFGEG
ncbi:alkaline phosphatase family protein [Lacihabitans soyangensis]|uniref:Alkaline phosphatase family protein n=1 Tax=Lacihabitans soyangensis TaxID=869394 RepID=A0AAE3KSV3_9BACT|nr:nucleotide pyrophosphatase/phosphodiesterase family protein [Lacihabitans soyangensis]MCP9763014.1 alkaline phosphatase family protein [Lacihabitans soyangensis]